MATRDNRSLDDVMETLGEARAPRQTREDTKRVEVWAPASTLPEPDKQPGYAYRWIRVSTNGEKDPRNISAKLREGWEPVSISEQPQFSLMVDPDSRFKDNVEVAGLLLCKAPEELMKQRKGYFASKNQSQMESVDNNFMRESDARMPLFREKKSSTSFGKGR
jgi:hypothetical protein